MNKPWNFALDLCPDLNTSKYMVLSRSRDVDDAPCPKILGHFQFPAHNNTIIIESYDRGIDNEVYEYGKGGKCT